VEVAEDHLSARGEAAVAPVHQARDELVVEVVDQADAVH